MFARIFRFAPAILLVAVLLCPLQSLYAEQVIKEDMPEEKAAENEESQPDGGERTIRQMLQSEVIEPVDASHDYLSGKLVSFASSVDRFFGDDRNYQESNQSVVQLDLTRIIGRGAERKLVLAGKAKIHLPNVEKRLHLVLETNPDKNLTGEEPVAKASPIDQIAAPESYAAAARIEKEEDKFWHLSTDAGIQFQGLNTSPFARARGRIEVPLDKWSLKAAETFFWFRNTGTGATTELDIERHINEPELFRARINASWLMETGNFDLRQDLLLYHTLDERTALLYQASAIGVSKPNLQVNEYVLLFLYRYRLHHEWVYAELSPQLHYPRADNYRVLPMLVFRLEVLFDDPH